MAKSSDVSAYVNNLTHCAICLEYYEDPRSLPCLHTFCQKCIRGHCRNACPGDDVQCSICRQQLRIPAEGVESLPHNFFVADLVSVWKKSDDKGVQQLPCESCGGETGNIATLCCVDCREKLCAGCGARCKNRKAGAHKVVNLGEEFDSKIVRHRVSYCQQHTSNQVEMYCNDCHANICTVCYAVKHKQHECLEIEDVAKEFSKQIHDSIALVSGKVADVKKRKQNLEETRTNFLAELSQTKISIHQKGEELKRQIDLKVLELLHQVETVKVETEKEITNHEKNIELALVALESFISYSREVVDKGTACDITRVANDLKTRANELKTKNTVGQYHTPGVSFKDTPPLTRWRKLFGGLCVSRVAETPSVRANQEHSLPETDREKCKQIYDECGVEGCREFLKNKREQWKTIPLNIAVIGKSGVGKSSFINVIRDLDDDDYGAAPVGLTGCTTDIQSYPHPHNNLIQFWDLPGVGSDMFPKAKYLEQVQVDRYDFFLLLFANKFTATDTWLVDEIIKRNKLFYCVRTKIAEDLLKDKMSHPKNHNEMAVLQKKRQSIEKRLARVAPHIDKVFLIDNYDLMKFDFARLDESLIEDLPTLKRSAVILSMNTFSEQMIKLKAAELRSRIQSAGSASSLAGAIPPVLGFTSMALCTVASDVAMAKHLYNEFGLDDKSLQKHADATGADLTQLQNIVRLSFGEDFFTSDGFRRATMPPAAAVALAAAQEFFRLMPAVGQLAAAPLSFAVTTSTLKSVLEKMELTALEVARYVAEHCIDDI